MNLSLMSILLAIPGILLGFTVHEYAHALVAHRLGDLTPKMQGRLTLNPIKHIDPFGFIFLLLFRFGWAKPVQTNPRNYKNGYKDEIKVSVAGIVANLLMAAFLGLIYRMVVSPSVYSMFLSDAGLRIYSIIANILIMAIQINCMLAVFNLLPLPSLDGFRILKYYKPSLVYKYEGVYYQYQLIIMVVLIFPIFGSSLLERILTPLISGLMELFT